jgi:hypothetical protein
MAVRVQRMCVFRSRFDFTSCLLHLQSCRRRLSLESRSSCDRSGCSARARRSEYGPSTALSSFVMSKLCMRLMSWALVVGLCSICDSFASHASACAHLSLFRRRMPHQPWCGYVASKRWLVTVHSSDPSLLAVHSPSVQAHSCPAVGHDVTGLHRQSQRSAPFAAFYCLAPVEDGLLHLQHRSQGAGYVVVSFFFIIISERYLT